MRKTEPTIESFLKDVEKHEMKVLLDNGVYRHLQCKAPGTFNQWFDIVTWPGHLAYSGDMGSFVFSRLEDMFKFFRVQDGSGELRINRPYWGEKLEAVDRDGRNSSHTQFSEDSLRQHIEEEIKTWVEECDEPYDADEDEIAAARKEFEDELRQAIKDDVYYYFGEGEHEARKAVNDFSFKPAPKRFARMPNTYEFQDTCEWDCYDYTFRFTWCCYAIVWAIRTYDAAEKQAAA